MENPHKEAKNTPLLKWMWSNHGLQMVGSFLFLMMFILAPHFGQWRIENDILRWSISIIMIGLNFVATFLHPYLTYKNVIRQYHRWEKNHGSKK
jgi:hypothetical protein